MTSLEKMLNEPTTWSIERAKDDYLITMCDFTINQGGEEKPLTEQNAKQALEPCRDNTLLAAYMETTPRAINRLLLGKDPYFTTEKIAITNDDEIKIYFHNREGISYPFLCLNKDKRPDFVVKLWHKSGWVIKRSHIYVDVDYCIHIEDAV